MMMMIIIIMIIIMIMLMTTTIIEKWLRTKIQDYILYSAKPNEVIVDREHFLLLMVLALFFTHAPSQANFCGMSNCE